MNTDLSHRGGLTDPIRPDGSLFERIGGRDVTDRIVDGLYDRIEKEPTIRPMFVRDLSEERDKQKDFWEEWLGGSPRHTQHHAYSGLRLRHSHLHITRAAANTWLSFLEAALEEAVQDAQLRDEVLDVARPIALSFVNEETPPDKAGDLRCRRIRPFRSLRAHAGKGDVARLIEVIDETPDLVNDSVEMAEVMLEACLKGRSDVVASLVDAGVDPNVPAHYKEGCIFQSLMLTPLCAALLKKRGETVELLRTRGAVYDIFSAAYLGDIETVNAMVAGDPDLVYATDPASDVLEMTPLHHAVYGGHIDVVMFLFDHGADVGANSTAMVRHAANHDREELTRVLIEKDADATRVGPGEWVLNEPIADLLMDSGADVNYPDGEWVWRSCTGNNSQRDNPDLVSGLLDRGAKIDTRLRGATPLHYVAKAGFVKSAEVLLGGGADPNAASDAGETPLQYAFKAGKRSDVPAMCRILVGAGADPRIKNLKGRTVLDSVRRTRREDREQIERVLDGQ